jgi:hypothetical protein
LVLTLETSYLLAAAEHQLRRHAMDDVTRPDAEELAHECARQGDGKPAISHRSLSTWQEICAGGSEAGIKLDAGQRAQLLSMASGDPPQGWTRWTLPRLAEELVRRGIVQTISPEDVRQALVEAILGRDFGVSPIEEEERCWF